MKGDFSRRTFEPKKHYSGVRMQQGRVQLDADWNEQADIVGHRHQTTTLDLVGGCGGPMHDAAFEIVRDAATLTTDEQDWLNAHDPKLLPLSAGDFVLRAGRYYAGGILCENENAIPYTAQPDLPRATPVTGAAALYVVYLDVWPRHLTALDDTLIREVALGGPDTATRTKTIWQVKLWKAPGATGTCADAFPDFTALTAPSSGRLSAQAKAAAPDEEPCSVPPASGYRGLENQLYRVEVHRGGTSGTATFKWSRDNGSVVTAIEKIDTTKREVTVTSLGRDEVLGFAADQWVEISDDSSELNGLPGQLHQIERVDPANRIVTLKTTPAALSLDADGAALFFPKLRRWDQTGTGATSTGVKTTTSFVELEQGVQVRFFAPDGTPGDGIYRTGDYWLIPARTATTEHTAAGIEWPPDELGNLDKLPLGIGHQYCRLGMLHWDGAKFDTLQDCRQLFPPVTELTSFFYLGGDGQEVMPTLTDPDSAEDLPLPALLQTGVANGQWPVEGAYVRFTVTRGKATLVGGTPSPGTTVTAITDVKGVAQVQWVIGRTLPNPPDNVYQVVAELLDQWGNVANPPRHLPITFTANRSVGYDVAYDPGECDFIATKTTVQDIVDHVVHEPDFVAVDGDGQDAMPGEWLPMPLSVQVRNLCDPYETVTVEFSTDQKLLGAMLSATSGGPGSNILTLTVAPDASGVVYCYWLPDPFGPPVQWVRAKLVTPAPNGVDRVLGFTANLSIATEVAYTPGDACTKLAGVETVAEALDQLCAITNVGCGEMVVPTDAVQDLQAFFDTVTKSAHVCVPPGDFLAKDIIRIRPSADAAEDSHLTVTGAGEASRIIGESKAVVLSFEGWQSVDVRDLSIVAEGEGPAEALLPGLRGEYYDEVKAPGTTPPGPAETFTELKLVRTDPQVAFNWGIGSPDPLVGPDTFSVRWTGFVTPPQTGDYRFFVVHDDGVRLWIDDQLVIDSWVLTPPLENQSTLVVLSTAQPSKIRLEFFENGGGATVTLSWSGPGVTKQIVPPGALSHLENPNHLYAVQGALRFVDCARVNVERVRVDCNTGTDLSAGCLSYNLTKARAETSARVRGCDFRVGQGQVGVIILDAFRADIEDNSVFMGASKLPPFSKLIAAAFHGIVVGGTFLPDTHVVRNTLMSVARPISVRPPDESFDGTGAVIERDLVPGSLSFASRALISGNTLAATLGTVFPAEYRGIFVGRCFNTLVDGNVVRFTPQGGIGEEPPGVGIQARGDFGAYFVVRDNAIESCQDGIRVAAANPKPQGAIWRVYDNGLGVRSDLSLPTVTTTPIMT